MTERERDINMIEKKFECTKLIPGAFYDLFVNISS